MPSISFIILLLDPNPNPSFITIEIHFNLIVNNGYRYSLFNTNREYRLDDFPSDHTYLCHLEMHNLFDNQGGPRLRSEVDQAILKNEWCHVEVQLIQDNEYDSDETVWLNDANPEMGLHVLKEKETMEADVIFTNPFGQKKPKSRDYEYHFWTQGGAA
ncbi:hypothetical protein QL285_097257 [Trifolium repens]|jgi:hypothetical protein|nr:hypothetical protein QL285_097257 [Trifolium repens]